MSTEQQAALPPQVTIIDRTSDASALAELYSEALALVNPTWQDNYPTVNLEAIACGTPVLTYHTGGSIESISPETGFVVQQGDVVSLSACIRHILKQGKEYYTGPCREYALRHFSRSDRFQDYIRLYEDLTTR